METNTEQAQISPKIVVITCPHCHKEIKTDQIEEVDCSNCGEQFLSIQMKHCPECKSQLCPGCAEDGFNEYGYCTDCSEAECFHCNETFYLGENKYKKCLDCEHMYCLECEKCFIDKNGLCIDCTKEETISCSDCGNTIIKDKASHCKNFAECGNAYCNDGRCEILDKNGYCTDCNEFECHKCGQNFPISEKIVCPNPDCRNKKGYCKDCFNATKDPHNNCIDCSSEPKVACKSCDDTTYSQSLITCDNCKRGYCTNCEELMPCTKCGQKTCSKCGSRCNKCQRPYCFNCMKFKNRKCKEHQGFFSQLFSSNQPV